MNRLPNGTHVRTVKKEKPSTDWTPEALKNRQFGVEGTVVEHHDSHGLCYGVTHNGIIGFYEPDELEVLKFPELEVPEPFEFD